MTATNPALFRPDPGKAARAQARLFAAAVRLFGEKGPDGATVRDIAAAAGQNVASIAYHFGSKEALYRAVLEGIIAGIQASLSDLLQEVAALRQEARAEPEAAGRLLKNFLSAIYLRLLSRDDAVSIVQIVVREQLGPTKAFEVLYDKGFRHIHEALCFLTGTVLGKDSRSREVILRTHILMGQVYFFAMSREAILRRAGWKTLQGGNAETVVKLVEEHVDVLLTGLRKNAVRPESKPK